MGLSIDYIDGQTPLDAEERDGLRLASITTRGDLDEFEQQNIENAIEWTMKKKFKMEYIFSREFVEELHYRMFHEVWKWAGEFRNTNKNLGVDKFLIGVELRKLLDDANFWAKNNTYHADEIAIRNKHRIVSIHCFPNGNGRHARLFTDVIISHIFQKQVFSWGRSNLYEADEGRKMYISALKDADKGNIMPLLEFAKS